MLRQQGSSRLLHGLLLLACGVLGAWFRLWKFAVQPVSLDEFETLVFSLGHRFATVPLNQIISAQVLLAPLQVDAQAHLGDVVDHLFRESTHPPLYFWLTHLWLRVGSPVGQWVSVAVARSLAVALGLVSIPAMFGLAYLTVGSVWVAHLSALLMATSPLGIYLAQEARHYTLPVLWVIASLACLVYAFQRHQRGQLLPAWLILSWVGVNGLGMASHYFFSLTLIAEGLTVAALGLHQLKGKNRDPQPLESRGDDGDGVSAALDRKMGGVTFWGQMGGVSLGTLATMVVWLPKVQGIQDSEITQWANLGSRADWQWWLWLKPVLELITQPVTIFYLLPLPNVLSTVILVVLLLGTFWLLYRGLRRSASVPGSAIAILGGFVLAAFAVFLAVTYGLEREITNATRYYFVFFPAVLVLLAQALVTLYRNKYIYRFVLMGVLGFSLLGALTVVHNLGYQKVHRPDVVTAALRETLPNPTLVAMLHRTHGQTGRLMAIAWDLWHQDEQQADAMRFLLVHESQDGTPPLQTLSKSLAVLPRPLNVWLLEFQGIPDEGLVQMLVQQGCDRTPQIDDRTDGYRYRLHRCEDSEGP